MEPRRIMKKLKDNKHDTSNAHITSVNYVAVVMFMFMLKLPM
jgi:hypothetical protein